ncbi:7-carboxy-7-deazaguanine synthase QueE [Candidatus Tachikawaea gelatinosa]|uniref:7-carboxy-7-deazaguanine synthase n=1 Tax=Candidatus Tachikawaea gelatinosa TaxID=1410383 RepID=A0A090BWG1_9ENTR|nr:7-carboxy-7-deazaguanine synthase QueE [Candidatus Tachikawaea gelatinosa]BAP58546.1 7-carboxy-7-deazaguanine synthase [Candidatus Tachikawaea gelatinosa]
MNYPINEVFQTLQGEGFYTGTPAIFIRMQYCQIKCNWCDTKYTWNKKNEKKISINNILKKKKKDQWCLANPQQLLNIILKKKWTARHLVITGGEPTKYDLRPLIYVFEKFGFFCQIETSGAYPIYCFKNTWVTVSPKKNIKKKSILTDSLLRANEIKYPVFSEKDISDLDFLLSILKNRKKYIVSLQPINQNNIATNICIKTCIARNWRLSVQMHKYLNLK